MRTTPRRNSLMLGIVAIAILASSATAALAANTAWNLYTPGGIPGDSASWLGNHNTNMVRWYNKEVGFTATPTIYPSVPTSTVTLKYLGYSYNGSAFTSFTATPKLKFTVDGIYSIDATGENLIGSVYEATVTLGIDRVRPTSTSNGVPVYDSTATVVLKASDALSGPEYLIYNLDDAAEWATPTPTQATTASFDVTLTVTGAGKHSLSYFVVDNAGNHEKWNQLAFTINAAGYKPVLGKPTASVKKHKVTFKGSVTAAATDATVTLTVQRKKGKYKAYATYLIKVKKYASKYSWAKTIKKSGTYRVRAAEGTGTSAWSKSFKIR